MRPVGPVRPSASGVFFFVLAVIVVLGAFSLWRLSFYKTYADEVRDRFARNTQYVSDLKVFAAEMRAEEAASVVASQPADAADAGLTRIDDLAALTMHSYEHVVHAPNEARAYLSFRAAWATYRRDAGQVLALAQAGRATEAAAQFRTTSHAAYDAASDSLAALADLNLDAAGDAAAAADAAYRDAILTTVAAVGLGALAVLGRAAEALASRRRGGRAAA